MARDPEELDMTCLSMIGEMISRDRADCAAMGGMVQVSWAEKETDQPVAPSLVLQAPWTRSRSCTSARFRWARVRVAWPIRNRRRRSRCSRRATRRPAATATCCDDRPRPYSRRTPRTATRCTARGLPVRQSLQWPLMDNVRKFNSVQFYSIRP